MPLLKDDQFSLLKNIFEAYFKHTRNPLYIRRRASAYLQNMRKASENEWLVWSDKGNGYRIRLEAGRVTCSCPYFQQEKGYCKHVCAVAAYELTEFDAKPWLKKLEKTL